MNDVDVDVDVEPRIVGVHYWLFRKGTKRFQIVLKWRVNLFLKKKIIC